MRLENKVALVTGGTSGIGQRTVERFREQGAEVVFTGRRAEQGNKVEQTTGALFIQADAGSAQDAERAIKQVLETYGRLDILMNNAGAPATPGRIEDLPLDGFDEAIRVHVRGALAHMKYAAPAMRAQKTGSIINIGSVAGHRAGYSGSLIYGVAKAAVIHLTRCAAMELGEDGVRVNSISPGGIATGIFAKSLGMEAEVADTTADKVKKALATIQAVPRAGLTDDIASAALYLASDEASFVNGEDMVIDGGLIWGRRYSEVSQGGGTWSQLFD
ncbi:MAG: SDR family oxidoreductase [Rhizobiales bacterium]|nr:SDR family oxidoreductase [Hyphomicrobiales bacterium]